jgi:hypothetical protein
MPANQRQKTPFGGSVAGLLNAPTPGNGHVPDGQVRYSLTCTSENHCDPLLTFSSSKMR